MGKPRGPFIRKLAEYLAGRQIEMSLKLEAGTTEGIQWADLRRATPLFGYPTVEEAEDRLAVWLGVEAGT